MHKQKHLKLKINIHYEVFPGIYQPFKDRATLRTLIIEKGN